MILPKRILMIIDLKYLGILRVNLSKKKNMG